MSKTQQIFKLNRTGKAIDKEIYGSDADRNRVQIVLLSFLIISSVMRKWAKSMLNDDVMIALIKEKIKRRV